MLHRHISPCVDCMPICCSGCMSRRPRLRLRNTSNVAMRAPAAPTPTTTPITVATAELDAPDAVSTMPSITFTYSVSITHHVSHITHHRHTPGDWQAVWLVAPVDVVCDPA